MIPNDAPTHVATIEDDAHAIGASAPACRTSSRVKCSPASAAATNHNRGHRRAAHAHNNAASKRIMRSAQVSECARLQALCVHHREALHLACATLRSVLARAVAVAHVSPLRSRSCCSRCPRTTTNRQLDGKVKTGNRCTKTNPRTNRKERGNLRATSATTRRWCVRLCIGIFLHAT